MRVTVGKAGVSRGPGGGFVAQRDIGPHLSAIIPPRKKIIALYFSEGAISQFITVMDEIKGTRRATADIHDCGHGARTDTILIVDVVLIA